MSVDTYFDESYFPGMGTRGEPPVITSPADGATVPPVHDVTGTAEPGQVVTLWSATGDDPLSVHSTVVADAGGNWASTGAQVTGRDGDLATFKARTLSGSSESITVQVAGPVLASIDPDDAVAGEVATYTLTGQRLDSTDVMVRVVDPGGTTTRVEPASVTASAITVDLTFTAEGTAEVSLAATGDGTTPGPELTSRLDVVVAAPAPAGPVLTSVTPDTADIDTETEFTLAGSGLDAVGDTHGLKYGQIQDGVLVNDFDAVISAQTATSITTSALFNSTGPAGFALYLLADDSWVGDPVTVTVA